MPPIKLQVAFQGGGAKLCDLLAAAQALQEGSKNQNGEKIIEVTRVAGTSAGAIVACLYASGIPIGEARATLGNLAKKHMNAITRPGGFGSQLLRIANGNAFYDHARFRRLLEELFVSNGRSLREYSHLANCDDVILTAVDIRAGKSRTYSKKATPGESFLDHIEDSCAIPFVFRGYNNGRATIDGGACNNLPVEALENDREKFGHVLGISFAPREDAARIEGNASYVGAIIDTMISHSVERSKKLIGDENVHEIRTDVGTFDFERCQSILLDARNGHYTDIKDRCRSWVDERVAEIAKPKPLPPATELQQLMKTIYDVHDLQKTQEHLRIKRGSLVVVARGLLDPHASDEIEDRLELTPTDGNLRSLRLSADGQAVALAGTRILAKGKHELRKGKDYIPVPVKVAQGVTGRDETAVVFFFGSGLVPQQGPYHFERHSTQLGSLEKLRQTPAKVEFITTTLSIPIDRYDIVVYVPDAYSNTQLQDAAVTNLSPPGFKKSSREGEKMEANELSEYPYRPGFVTLGWKFQEIVPGDSVGIMLIPVNVGG